MINKRSGLKGLSGISNDMREIEKAAQDGDKRALLAVKTFCYHVRKYVGSYMAAMGGWGILDYGINFAAEPSDWPRRSS